MKTIYDVLNQAKVTTEEYDATPLNDIEKETIKQKLHHSIVQRKKKLRYRYAATAACLMCVIAFTQTAYAKETLNHIIQTFTIGSNIVIQIDTKSRPFNEQDTDNVSSQQEKYYDKDGNPINEITGDTVLYDKNGKKIGIASKNGNKFSIVMNDIVDPEITEETDLSKAISKLDFQAKLPKKLPVGYQFANAALNTDEIRKADGNCITINYAKGKDKIVIVEWNTSNTDGSFATDGSLEKIKVNGYDAALAGKNNLTWEQNGVNINIFAPALTREEVLSLAESLQ